MSLSKWCFICCCGALVTGGSIGAAPAQTYPTKAIRLIVGFGPGGPNDFLARLVGQRLAESFGVPVVVDNRPGADSVIGTNIAARAAADGYTLGVVSASATIHPNVYTNLPYSIVKDFSYVTILATSSYVLVVHPSIPATSVSELIAVARAKPGQLNYASPGLGDPLHLAMELFKSMAGIDVVHVPYKGGGAATTGLIAGEASAGFSSMLPALPHVKSGKLRGLAVTTAKRSQVFPELPTVGEAGVPKFEVTGWYGIVAPSSTPRPIIDRLNVEIVKVIKLGETRERFATIGIEPMGNSPDEMAAYIRTDIEKWGRVVKAANISIGTTF
ncbi:MAG: tripartite tricarboxylate transporter substrate binding protein [Betaproteobacteria bacterium]|nr:tripartite tricarboxylate transporter substrate binding protein [Betaproteobacteria bacterium]